MIAAADDDVGCTDDATGTIGDEILGGGAGAGLKAFFGDEGVGGGTDGDPRAASLAEGSGTASIGGGGTWRFGAWDKLADDDSL